MTLNQSAPKDLGYTFPAEWEKHEATWLSFPHNLATWPPKRMEAVQNIFLEFIYWLSQGEKVRILIQNQVTSQRLSLALEEKGAEMENIQFYNCPTDDAWIRDYGPAFLLNKEAEEPKILIDWEFNAWGAKYPNYKADNSVPSYIAQTLEIPRLIPNIVMEGGSIEVNGRGTLLTTRVCLLSKQRNPHLDESAIEIYLKKFYGQEKILWLDEGMTGSDTDSHIDEITRFVNEDTVVTSVAQHRSDEHYKVLKENYKTLSQMHLADGKALNVIELPLPSPFSIEGERMPASYANFYIANQIVIMPTFACKEDSQALAILEKCFPERQVIGLDSRDIIWGLGSFHCLSQQEPAT